MKIFKKLALRPFLSFEVVANIIPIWMRIVLIDMERVIVAQEKTAQQTIKKEQRIKSN